MSDEFTGGMNDRPVVAWLVSSDAVGAPAMIAAAKDWCELVFVNTGPVHWEEDIAESLADAGRVVEHLEGDAEVLADLLSACAITGVCTWSDDLLALVSAVAIRLGLPGHSARTVLALTDKSEQRRRLAADGVLELRSTRLERWDETALAAALQVGYPAVLKPTAGTGSAHVYPVDSEAELRELLRNTTDPLRRGAGMGRGPIPAEGVTWHLEQRIPDGCHPVHSWLGDYISVESVALGGGDYWHFMTTDRLPLLPPFREQGVVVPSQLPSQLRQGIHDLVTSALRALEVEHGVTHTEVKLSPQGPRIIEVNGRVGGYQHDIIPAVCELSPALLVLRSAIGAPSVEQVATVGVATAYIVQPPIGATEVRNIVDVSVLQNIPGVWRVVTRARSGDPIDYRLGTFGSLQTIWIWTENAAAMAEAIARIRTAIAENDFVLEPS